MILKQKFSCPKFYLLFLSVKKGKVVSQPFEKNNILGPSETEKNNPQHHLLGWLGRQSCSFTVESSQLHSSQRYVLNCTPVRSNGGVSNFYEKDRPLGQRQMMGFSLTQANDC